MDINIAVKKARTILTELKEFPEDEWFSISDEWDLNIYLDMDGKKRMSIYPVINGCTITETWIDVDFELDTINYHTHPIQN